MDKAQVIDDIKYKEWKDAFEETTKVNEYVFETREQAKTHLKSIDFCLAVWMDACEYMEMKSQASDDLERIDNLDIDEICHIKCKTRKSLIKQNKIMCEALEKISDAGDCCGSYLIADKALAKVQYNE